MAELTLAEQVAQFAWACAEQGVPDAVQSSVNQRVLDVLGLCVAAYRVPTSDAVASLVDEQGGRAQARAVGLDRRVPASQAALLNGVLAHSLDYDDTHLPSVLHPSACVVPAALAAAELSNASGAQLVSAVAAGLEVTVRLGMAGYDETLGNSVFFEHGQHATSICGALGGAVAAAMLMGLGPEGVQNALGVAASMASGIIEGNRSGGTVKRMHCGWAAHAAVVAAQLVERGVTGPPTVLEGRFGFFEAFLRGEVEEQQVTDALGERWSVPDIFFKPYPANHFTHAAVDAGLALRARGLVLADIERITLRVPTAVVRTIGEPLLIKQRPQTGYQAQFSGPYAVVAGLVGGSGLGVGLQDYRDELAQDPERRALMARVDVVGDERCDAIFPHQLPAIVEVEAAGSTWVEEVLVNRGGPDRPLSSDELAAKFRDNVQGRLAGGDALRVQTSCSDLGALGTVRELTEPLGRLSNIHSERPR
ncbi:MAG TPA: MmgE/PrpD family protein [Actinomycetales bacterium]|nr:MmgE/PrpD family protein [Actinomycetales bacterium]